MWYLRLISLRRWLMLPVSSYRGTGRVHERREALAKVIAAVVNRNHNGQFHKKMLPEN